MNIVIMGATSHIAKGLIDRFLNRGEERLFLFSRSKDKVFNFCDSLGGRRNQSVHISDDYQTFSSNWYDVIINCVGVETRNKHNCDFTRYFTVTEEFDNLAVSYLRYRNPEALYMSFSSGAVYGKGFATPADESSVNRVQVNNILPEDYYGIARINAEAKHRSNADLRIMDLRIFSYFSRHINLTDGYFITDVMQAVLNGKVLVTDTADIVRDYLHPDDLFSMISKCIKAGKANRALDVTSSRPASKQEILDYFASVYGLKYEKRPFSENGSATGAKSNYYSVCNLAAQLGYTPRFSSIDTLKEEAGYILAGRQRT